MESCEKLEPEKRWVSLHGFLKDRLFFLEMKNSMTGDLLLKENGQRPFSTKADAVNHGFGLKNIENSVKKYDGNIECEAVDGIFRLTVILQSPCL